MTRDEARRLGRWGCMSCGGTGKRGDDETCECVWRGAYRVCLLRYLEYKASPKLWGREFCADFELVGRRELEGRQLAVWRWSIARVVRWRERAHRLGLGRGQFFYALDRAQVRLGRVYAELAPYRLWPVREYFVSGMGSNGSKCEGAVDAGGARRGGEARVRS